MAAFALPPSLFLLFSVIFITDAACTGTDPGLCIFRAEFLLEFGVRDFRRWFNIVRSNNVSRRRRRLSLYIAWSTSCDTEQLKDIVELAV
jgi:hypothetical protein